MDVRRLDRRKIDLPEPAMRALQLLAQLDRLTAQEMLERLILDFLELRWEEISALEQALQPRSDRPLAKVIDLDARRRRDTLRRSGQIPDVMQRSRALREHSSHLCQRSRSVRSQARQRIRDADAAWARYAG